MNYYNEFDPKAASWLRELISEGLIPYGTVDERSITEVSPTDLAGYTQCHFFAGIGGWPYALRLAGWPDDQPVWTGSCPCQPFSCAGKGLGEADERHLWPVFRELIRACKPPTVFGEQVASAAVIGSQMQGMRKGKTARSIPLSQQGRSQMDLPVLREQVGKNYQAMEIGCKAGISTECISNQARNAPCVRCQAKSQSEGHSLFDQLERNPEAHREWLLRGNGNPVRLISPCEILECAVTGPNTSGQGLHEREYQGCPICGERDGGSLGLGNDSQNFRSIKTKGHPLNESIPSHSRTTEKESNPVWLDGVFADLEAANYTCGACVLGAHSVNSPHIRQRLFWVAYTKLRRSEQCNAGQRSILQPDANGTDGRLEHSALPEEARLRQQSVNVFRQASFWSSAIWHQCRDGKARRIPRPEPGVLGVASRLPEGVDAGWLESGFPLAPKIQGRVQLLKGYGNAIVPQLAAEFILASLDAIADDGGS